MRTNRWPSACTEISTRNTTAVSQKTKNNTGGNKAQQVGQHLYRDLIAEHNSSVTKTKNKIQKAIRPTRWASTCTEISTLNTATASGQYKMRCSWQ